MKARDVMTMSVVTANPDSPLGEIVDLMLANRISAVPVVDAAHAVVGIVSEGDLMNRADAGTRHSSSWWLRWAADTDQRAGEFRKIHGHRAKDVMTRNVLTVSEEATVAEIAKTLERHRIKRVPIVRDGKLVGIVSRANLLHGIGQLSKMPALQVANADESRGRILERLAEAGLRPGAVNVIVTPDLVELWGYVESPEQIPAAEVAVASVLGDRAIDNHIELIGARFLGGFEGA